MLNLPIHYPIEYCKVDNYHDHESVEFLLRIHVLCQFQYFLKSTVTKKTKLSKLLTTNIYSRITFNSVLSSDINPKLSPEKSAENIRQQQIIVMEAQVGSTLS